ncbi:DNA-binding protein [Paenibacillus sp. H1-7]|uniref:DNA-binding protein n=1 Tax=Paenibacillus sp. H1-7 TaxID=2282849 RepID=UPI001EF8E77E|nr:DNA-binding protein [Paenibacillus sp. H1-7]ULL17503.1 DNA-binding protein [Paenibacillus sp. H1-7]
MNQKKIDELPEILDVKDIKDVMNIGINQAYELVNFGKFHVVRVGPRRIKIPKEGFVNWLNGAVS